jgi:hypothetical protein
VKKVGTNFFKFSENWVDLKVDIYDVIYCQVVMLPTGSNTGCLVVGIPSKSIDLDSSWVYEHSEKLERNGVYHSFIAAANSEYYI